MCPVLWTCGHIHIADLLETVVADQNVEHNKSAEACLGTPEQSGASQLDGLLNGCYARSGAKVATWGRSHSVWDDGIVLFC